MGAASVTRGCRGSSASVHGSGEWEPPARGCRSTELCTSAEIFVPAGFAAPPCPNALFCSAAGRAGKAGEEEKAELTRSLQGSVAVTLPLPSCTFPGCSRGRHPSPENISCPGLGAELLGAAHWVLEGRQAASSQWGERTSPGCSQELTGE